MAAPEISKRGLLERFGLMAEEDLAAILGVSVKTLKNRRREELPDFVKAGRRRLFVEESVRDFLDAHRVRGQG
jgi:predicted nucleotidyltransferase